MTSRPRPSKKRPANSTRPTKVSHQKRRRNLLETLEPRQLLAGPQLVGIQPNDGELIVEGSVRNEAPRALTFRFDEVQEIDAATFSGIQLQRAGSDGEFGTADDVTIQPGLVTLGDNANNEVVVRFADSLPDDLYRASIFGVDSPSQGIVAIRNSEGDAFQPSIEGQGAEVINFELRLGALIEAVVPQPVVRTEDGSLVQNRNEIVVYFNEDPLFVEDDSATGTITVGTQQIAITGNLVGRTFDDAPIEFAPSATATSSVAVLDASTGTITVTYPTATATFANISAAIDSLADFSASVVAGNPSAIFIAPPGGASVAGNPTERSAENPRFYQLLLTQDTVRTTDDALYFPETVVYDDVTHTARLIFADDINNLGPDADGNAGVGIGGGTFRLRIGTAVDDRVDLILPPTLADLTGTDAGETLSTAFDVGVLDNSNGITSLLLSESISPQPFNIELPGGSDDPGRREISELAGGGLVQFVNAAFGDPNSQSAADVTDGITEISYNFQGIFASDGGDSFLNQITDRQKDRVREALDLWSRSVGVQFRETVDSGITFAVGDPSTLPALPDTRLQAFSELDATVRIDPTFTDSAIVFSNQANFNTAFGEDFSRKTAAGIGFLIGLEQAPGLPLQTLLTLSPQFLDASINSFQSFATPEQINAADPFFPNGNNPNPFLIPNEQQEVQFLEHVFPGNFDILHGQFVHRPDSNDIDLYRFVVDLDDADRVGTLTVETFAERLPDSSSLDSTLVLYQETKAAAVTSFGVGVDLSVQFDSLREGKLGNNTTIGFVSNDGTTVSVTQQFDGQGNQIGNGLVVSIPRSGASADAVVAAINGSPLSAGLLTGTVITGGSQIVGTADLNLQTVQLTGGDVEQLSRNDDYFSEDSRIIASLGEGTYYVGVTASGNDTYDPTIPDSGFGGLTQGRYDLSLRFEPQVDEVNVIRDIDDPRTGVPGTPIDGDGDGLAGGLNNFFFQTRAENRLLSLTGDGSAVVDGQTLTLTGANGVTQVFEFVAPGSTPLPGNIPVSFDDGSVGPVATPAASLVDNLRNAINSRPISETGVRVSVSGLTLEFTGEQSIALSTDFVGAETFGRNIFVDKTAGPNADGSLSNPFNNIAGSTTPSAFDATLSGDIVRIVGNGGLDSFNADGTYNPNSLATEEDNFSYQVGVSNFGGLELEDGRNLEVPQGVTAIFDAGAIVKLNDARIAAGSSSLFEDRSESVIQVLGTPRHVQLSAEGSPVTTTLVGQDDTSHPGFNDGSVIFTSINDPNADASTVQSTLLAPAPGDWGGLVFRRDLDISEGRSDLEDEGIFLRNVNHAQIRYGGTSNTLIDSVPQLVNPIQIFDTRPTVSFSEISFSADSAISASPNSFEETSYLSPRFQQAGAFNPDYSRVGPDFHNNLIVNNSINGLFIRAETTSELPPQELSLSARFDDISVVHFIAENIVITGTPGGSIQDGVQPALVSASFETINGGTLDAGTYDYRLTFVDAGGFESLASNPSAPVTVGNDSSIRLSNLQPIAADSDYLSRRLYRLDPASGDYIFIANLDATDVNFLDNGAASTGVLDLSLSGIRGRLDASLVIDPGAVIKLRGSRIEIGQGAQLIAEGTESRPIIFTSSADDRFGAGGTFDTTNDANSPSGSTDPVRGDWAGIYASPNAFVSLDHTTIAYGGGVSLITGGQTSGFAALELHQADARVANSQFQFNDNGQDGSAPIGRLGRLSVTPSTIYVEGSQPIIVNNEFVDNRGVTIDIDADSLTDERIIDLGRQTGDTDRFASLDDNFGPLIRLNRYQIVPSATGANQQVSGLEIRGGELTTASVWDDTDIVHLLFDTVEVGNLHSVGGLRLISRDDESLVVKLSGAGSPFSERSGTGISASGTRSSIDDRIGGSVQIVGLPGAPVILTSFADDTVGAGLTIDGEAFTDNNGDSFNSRPAPNDWRSILLDEYSNDRNFDYILERNITSDITPGLNGSANNAQSLGDLAPNVNFGDDQLRLGFEVEGYLSSDSDVDTFSFTAEAGTQIWVDVDSTSFTLDSVIEILDADGNVLARSDNSFDEVAGTPLQGVQPILSETAGSLEGGTPGDSEFGAGGLFEDYGSTNPRDAGISLSLPGNRGTRSIYFFRIRSASENPGDASGGITNGGYRFQLRLQEQQEFAGSVVRHADIRYANTGIHVRGLIADSPLLGDAQENEIVGGVSNNGSITSSVVVPGQRAQYIGDLLFSEDKTFSVGGTLTSVADIDFYQIDVIGGPEDNLQGIQDLQTPTVFDIDYADGFSRPDTSLAVFYDADGEFGPQAPQLVFFGESSNVLDDQASTISTDSLELLTRGSISTNDPLIGPVSLTRGTYYVGVVADGAVPDALNSLTVRREPIESLVRIFEDHVESNGGSTADDPLQPSFTNSAALNPGWVLTSDRATDAGHQLTTTFNRSRGFASSEPSVQFEENVAGDTIANFQDLTAGDPTFSLASDPNVGDTTINTSNLIPHTKVLGTTANEVVDIYRFEVTDNGSRVILDIDGGFNPAALNGQAVPDDLPDGVIALEDPDSVDLQLHLLDAAGNIVGGPNSTSLAANGALGSEQNRTVFFDPLTVTEFTNDPYIETALPAGIYFVAVSPEGTLYDTTTGTFTLGETERPASGTYELNVSVENHPSDTGVGTNQSYRFDRSVDSGTLSSLAFDLSGYSAADLPRFYFNYFLNEAAGDNVTIQVRQGDLLTGTVTEIDPADFSLTPSAATETVWRQGIISLEQFAGMSDLSIEFVYETNATILGAEGLYLDDLIVGFAERGELITDAAAGVTTISGGNQGLLAGEYQLEVRPGTEHGISVVNPVLQTDNLVLTESFDTNDRHVAGSASIVAPHADQISDGDSFTLSDGSRSVRFEFDLEGSPAATAGSIRIPYRVDDPSTTTVDETSSQAEIADAIRDAINLDVVRSIIEISATDSTGSATGGSGDNVVVIAGTIVGDFNVLTSTDDLPESGTPLNAAGDFRLPVVFTSGVGDSNVTRSQSVVIVENNRISNVLGIGIWSETSDRGVDPEDTFNGFVSRAPVGTTNPGAVRNLPTLNNAVTGGEAPGIVIRNNSIDQAGYAGIKVEGDIRPFAIDSGTFAIAPNINDLFGDLIADGLTFTIDSNGVRVVFEFEDVAGSIAPLGSGQLTGDGFVDGHVPVYYQRTTPAVQAYSRYQVMASILSSIQGSILVTNGIIPLVESTLASSLIGTVPGALQDINNAAVYIEGATSIQFSTIFQGSQLLGNPFNATGPAAVFDSAQPVARIVNNTIRGNDGTASNFVEPADSRENDLIAQAILTQQGRAHTGPYLSNGTIAGPGDVDLFQVQLGSGDRLIADIDTIVGAGVLPADVDTTLRVFNENGIEVAISTFGLARADLDLNAADAASTVDPFIDFTATVEGTYYVGVSSAANSAYDANSISGRGDLADGSAFAYSIGVEVYAPRTFVLSFDNNNNGFNGNNQGSTPAALIGTTFTVTQVADLANNPTTNVQNYTVVAAGTASGNPGVDIQVPAAGNVSQLSTTIAAGITGGNSGLLNQAAGNGPNGLSGPIPPVTTTALGGAQGNAPGLELFNPFVGRGGGFNFSIGGGGTELYVVVQNAAEISISAGSILRLDPVGGVNIDQLIPETGILVTGGGSATVLNNALSNLHQGLVLEETRGIGFFPAGPNQHPKLATVISTANTFQHIETANNVFRANMTQPFIGGGSIGIINGPSNVNAANDDFNVTLGNTAPLFVNGPDGNFLPAFDSAIIDSSVSAVTQRDRLTDVLQSVGLSMSNVLAPSRDIDGVLRADNPDVSPPTGLGSQIIIDRGSTERADFVGPVALALNPSDNESVTGETDPFVSVIQLPEGVYDEFRIQLRDTGDASDPFNGQGIDDSTVVVAAIDGLRTSGANVTVFENDQLLTEGIDYSFNYDANQNVITLTPLAGIWRNDRSYRVLLNNQDRNVIVVPPAADLADGQQLSIVDSSGGELVFEFETGFSLFAPQPITLEVPATGAGAGGLLDGDTFQIDDGVNPPVIFEFNSDVLTLPGTEPVLLESLPVGDFDFDAHLGRIAAEIFAAIQRQVDVGALDVDLRVIGNQVIVGANRGATADTSGGALNQPARTLALAVPSVNSIADGDQLIVSDGLETQGFEFTFDANVTGASNLPINIAGATTSAEIAIATRDAINQSDLMLGSMVAGSESTLLYLNLPVDGSVDASDSNLSVVGVSRTPVDGETIVLSPSDDGPAFTLELDNDGVIDATINNNVGVSFTRLTTADELNLAINNAIDALPAIAGLSTDDIAQIAGGQLSIGGLEGLSIAASGPSIQITGEPSVAGATGIEVFGPLLLVAPPGGGGTIIPGSVFSVIDADGQETFFEFRIDGGTAAPNLPAANFIPYTPFDSTDQIRDAIVAAVNAATVGVNATATDPGTISFGRIADGSVNIAGRTIGGVAVSGLLGSSVRRGTVADGELLTISQGDISVTYEFETAVGGNGVAAGNVRVAFTEASTAQEVAQALAAAIINNRNGLLLDPIATAEGTVELNDVPGTIVDVTAAPTLSRFGVPGGAIPVRILPSFGSTEVKRALLTAINSINQPGEQSLTSLAAQDRGGDTLFVSGATSFGAGISNFALPAISDLSGNPLEPNRNDDTTQITYLLPSIGLDYGDAPDPVAGVVGRFPTTLVNDGARHIVGGGVLLGTTVDANVDGIPTAAADGDDSTLVISETGTLFTITVDNGVATVGVNTGTVDPLTRDGDTIVIDTGVAQATLEFDTNGRFDEDNFAISPTNVNSAASIAQAIQAAINTSPVDPASVTTSSTSVTISGDDEDGVQFVGTNGNVVNAGIATPIEVTVTGSGVLEAWIDFNADGDWDDPGEQIIPFDPSSPFADRRDELCPVGENGHTDNNFGGTGDSATRSFCIIVPPTTPAPTANTDTYARFRVSVEGGLSPTGLALSGEVEDYLVRLTNGLPPTITDSQANQNFSTNEDTTLVVAPTGGLLNGVTDPNGDPVTILSADVTAPGTPRDLFTVAGALAGQLNLASDGSFDFTPVADFNGIVQFTASVTDGVLNSPRPITVIISVDPVNDMPERGPGNTVVSRSISEDTVQTFTVDELIFNSSDPVSGPLFVSGPANESGQGLIFDSVSSSRGANLSEQGGTLQISADGTEITYTPPQDFNGTIPDTFNYLVVDVPSDGTTPVTATVADQGLVEILISPVNDEPIAVNDSFQGLEEEPLTILINGGPDAILDNDTGGPADENQTVTLVTSDFPMQTDRGGNVRIDTSNNTLIYTPPGLFSGIDTFQYQVADSDGLMGTATVSINLSNVNNNPIFEGVNGEVIDGTPVATIQREESKAIAITETFDLNTWFSDPENGAITYTVSADNASVAIVSQDPNLDNLLTIEYPPFSFGTANLTITATDSEGAVITIVVAVDVQNTEDAPTSINQLVTLNGVEDQNVTSDLRTVFNDQDNQALTYSVARLGLIANPTAAQIADHPFIESIQFVGDELLIILQPNQFGSESLIEIAASDGISQVSNSFVLNVASVPDAPVAINDSYVLPIGSALNIFDAASGLLRNDFDADNEAISIQLETVAGEAATGITLNADGTFVFQSPTGGQVGDQTELTYQIIDSTGSISNRATVTFTLNQSRFQNPVSDLREDVTADGNISALDALRVLNFLQRNAPGSATPGSVPVSSIQTAPPDFYDVNGDGEISALDALLVVNRLRDLNNSAESEFIAPAGSNMSAIASSAITSSIVSPNSTGGMPSRQLELVEETESTITQDQATDRLLADGLSIDSEIDESVADWIGQSDDQSVSPSNNDGALAAIFDEAIQADVDFGF